MNLDSTIRLGGADKYHSLFEEAWTAFPALSSFFIGANFKTSFTIKGCVKKVIHMVKDTGEVLCRAAKKFRLQ